MRHTWAADGAGANSEGPRSADWRLLDIFPASRFEAERGVIGVAAELAERANRGSGTGTGAPDATDVGAMGEASAGTP